MKTMRYLCFILAVCLCLGLWSCGLMDFKAPETDAPEETPTGESTEPVSTSEAPTEIPTETETPAETETPTQTEAPALKWEDAYAALLTAFRSEYPIGQSDCSFSLYDLNGDMIPEIFIRLGTCEADFEYSVFTFTQTGAEQIGTLNGSHSGLCGLSGQNACLLQTAIQGYESVTKITMVGRSLTQQVVFEGTPAEYHSFTWLPSYQLEDRAALVFHGNPSDNNQSVLDSSSDGLPYTITIPFADQSIFSEPSYDGYFVQTVELAGVYTIVEEHWDSEGNLWGRLKSGVGWVDLTDIQYKTFIDPPISANYADKPLLDSGNYETFYDAEGGALYGFTVAFRAYETLTNVHFYRANLAADSGLELTELYSFYSMDPDYAFVAGVYFPGDMSAYAITFTDSIGITHTYILTTSGRNGSLVFYEY